MNREEELIKAVRRGDLGAVAVASTSERITVALALGRFELMPDGWQHDQLAAYKARLDDRQRAIVDHFRGFR